MKINSLIVIRHGETEWNIERKLQGQNDSKLTQLGYDQARLASETLQNEKIDFIYSSDLSRCVKTLELLNLNCKLQVVFDKRLRERNYGLLQGMQKKEMVKRFPETEERLRRGNLNFDVPGGEDFETFYRRCNDFINFINDTHNNEHILLVTHGGVLDCLMRKTTGLSLDANRCFSIFNTSINKFTLTDTVLRLDLWGDTNHLKSLSAIDEL